MLVIENSHHSKHNSHNSKYQHHTTHHTTERINTAHLENNLLQKMERIRMDIENKLDSFLRETNEYRRGTKDFQNLRNDFNHTLLQQVNNL